MNNNNFLGGILILLIVLTALVIVSLFNTWIIMVFIGMLHHTFEWPAQTYSYTQLFPVVLVGAFVTGIIRGIFRKD